MKKFIVCLMAGVLCGISVSAQSTLGGLYQVITSTSDFAAGDTVILVSYDESKNMYAMGTYDGDDAFYAINIGTTTADYLPSTITLNAANTAGKVYEYRIGKSSSTVSLRNGGNYVTGGDANSNLTQSSSVCYWTPYKYSNEVNYPYNAVCLKPNKGAKFISYTPTYGFKNYASSPVVGQYLMRAYCYKKVGTNNAFRIGSTGYATMYYGNNDVELPEGLTAYTMNVTKKGGKFKLHMNNIGTTVPHGTGVIVKGTANTDYYPTIYSAAATKANGLTSVEGNMLHGTDTEEMQSNGDGYYFKLTNHATKGVGFYWGEDGGAAFTNKAHKAYLFLPAEMAPASISDIPFSSMEEGGVTLVKEVRSTETQDMTKSVYDLKGRRVDAKGKGLRILNGKKLIMK